MSKKFLSDVLIECGLQVDGTTTLGTATATTVATSDNSTNIATTAWVKALGYSTTDSFISDVSLSGSTLSFTGINSAFTGSIDLSGITSSFNASEVETVYATVRNVSGVTLQKGTPLAVVPGQTSGNVSDVVPADAADPAFMPAVFILNEDLANEVEGEAVVFGEITGIDTSAFDSGTTVYVAPGGGWTATKPTGQNLIQNLGIITKSHATNGGGVVMGAGRSNDVPNIQQGYAWVGNANGVATPTLLGSLAYSSATYDNYGSWNLKTNGVQRTTVQSGGNLDIVAGTNVSVSYGAGGVVTISSTDTNTDTNNYLTGLSFNTGDGVLTATRQGLGNVTVDLDGRYLPLSGGTIARESQHITQGSISANNAHLDLYNTWESDTDQKGSIITFTDNYFDGSNYNKTLRAAIKGGTDTTGNTADGYLEFYTDSAGANSPNLVLRLDKFKNATFYNNINAVGTVTGSNLNISNWDTAYGWGDHSQAGYLTSFSETDTLATVTSRGSSTTSAITTGGITATYGWFGGTGTAPQIRIFTENGTASIADTFADTSTDKSYIHFLAGTNSNDPGYIMHETSESADPDERNEGVLHLVPSDDNSFGDYVSIHGTNDPDCVKIHTNGMIETSSSYQLQLRSGSGYVRIDDGLSVSAQINTDSHGDSSQWNSAYGWGDHSSAGYLTSETVTSLSLSANVLRYTDENGTNTDLDLSLYLDDTNLARLTSGTLNGTTGIATFTRDDNSTFTVDFSAFLADGNNYADSLAFSTSTGVLTLGRNGSLSDLTVDLDGRYLTGLPASTGTLTKFTNSVTIESNSDGILNLKQTDAGSTPGTKEGGWNYIQFLDGQGDRQAYFGIDSQGNLEFNPEVAGAVVQMNRSMSTTGTVTASGGNSNNWNTAYNWGDHSAEGYLTSYTETDTLNTVTGRGAITSNAITTGAHTITGSHSVITSTERTAGDPAAVVLEAINTATYYGAFIDYVIHDGSRDSQRAGTFTVTWNQVEIRFSETATMDIGDTSVATLDAVINGSNADIRFTAPDPAWEIKYTLRLL